MPGKPICAALPFCAALALVAVAFLSMNGAAVAETIQLPRSGTVTDLKEHALYLPDPEKQLSPEELLASDAGFQSYDPTWEKQAPPLWLKLDLQQPPEKDGSYLLLVKRRFFQRLEIYAPTADGRHERTTSGVDEYQPTSMFGHWFVYPIDLGPDNSGQLLIHVKVIQSSLAVLDLQIEDALTFHEHRSQSLWAYGLYFGAMLALIFYNFILYLTLRTPGHRLYVATMASVIVLMAMNSGLLQEWLPLLLQTRWPLPSLTMHCLVAGISARFFQVFVSSKHFIPRTHRIVSFVIGLNLVFGAMTLFWPHENAVGLAVAVQPLGSITTLLLILSSLWAGIRGSRSGYIFFAAWCTFALGAVIWSLLSFNVIERTPVTEYSLYIGSVMEAMILALGLSYRVGQLRTQRNIAIREQQKAARLANIDPLTGAYNRRFVENYLDGLLHSEDKRAFQGSLIMIDLDNFKPINDEFGHPAGDEVLQEVVRRCNDSLRAEDVLARLGGDEFAIVLPDQSGTDSASVAERIRERIASKPASYGMQPISIAVSIGVVTDFKPGATAYSAFKHADQALYEAKRAGRNKVVIKTGGEEPIPDRNVKATRPQQN